MARPYRLQGENLFYHITSRGDGRKKIYISEYDHNKFLEYVLKAKERYKFRLYAYVLMPNHFHLLVETLRANLSQIMHHIKSSYTTYYNTKRKSAGHLFQGRFKSILVDKDNYFLSLTRYIHLNPVRAKIVKSPEEYKWSSYKAYLNGKRPDKYIDKSEIREILGNMSISQYRQFTLENIGIEDTPFKNLYAGFILGNTRFIKERLKELKGQVEGRDVSYRDELMHDIDREDIVNTVAKKHNKTASDLYNAKSRHSKEKKIAIYLIKKLTCLTNKEIGRPFKLSPTAVIKAALSIEDLARRNKRIKKDIEEQVSAFSA